MRVAWILESVVGDGFGWWQSDKPKSAQPNTQHYSRAAAPNADERKRLRELAADLEMVHGQHAGDNAVLADAVAALREIAGDD